MSRPGRAFRALFAVVMLLVVPLTAQQGAAAPNGPPSCPKRAR